MGVKHLHALREPTLAGFGCCASVSDQARTRGCRAARSVSPLPGLSTLGCAVKKCARNGRSRLRPAGRQVLDVRSMLFTCQRQNGGQLSAQCLTPVPPDAGA
jgi:hypothetical protein